MELWEYLQANNNVLNARDDYRYRPSQKDLDILSQGVIVDNVRSQGNPVHQYKGILRGHQCNHGDYLYKLYKQSLEGK